MQRFVQLALDFLTGPEPVVSAPRPAAPRPPADEPLSAVFQPGTWHHPRANRLLKLGHCEVAYEFKRGKRRTIGLTVTAGRHPEPGDAVTLRARLFDDKGRFIREADAQWALDGLEGSIAGGRFTSAGTKAQAGLIKATAGGGGRG